MFYYYLESRLTIVMILSSFIVADQTMLSGTLRSVPEASVIPLSCRKFVCAATYQLPGITKNSFNDVGIQTAWAHLLIVFDAINLKMMQAARMVAAKYLGIFWSNMQTCEVRTLSNT